MSYAVSVEDVLKTMRCVQYSCAYSTVRRGAYSTVQRSMLLCLCHEELEDKLIDVTWRQVTKRSMVGRVGHNV